MAVTYRLASGAYGFNVGAYDPAQALFIDPLLASTLLGGDGTEACRAVAVDGERNVYVAGRTMWTGFPTTPGVADTNYNGGYDVFVSKFDPDLTNLLASTFLGGTNSDCAYAVALDSTGNVFVAGFTTTTNFPVTAGAFQHDYGSGTAENGFVAKLSPGLSNLIASTFLGGDDADYIRALIVAADGTIYVGSYDGNFYAFNPDGTTQHVWVTTGGIDSSPIIGGDGTIYVGAYSVGTGSGENALYAFNPDGTTSLSYQVGGSIYSGSALDDSGTIYVGCRDSNVYAFAGTGRPGYIPAQSDYDGDGLCDLAIREETINAWSIWFSAYDYLGADFSF